MVSNDDEIVDLKCSTLLRWFPLLSSSFKITKTHTNGSKMLSNGLGFAKVEMGLEADKRKKS